MNIRISAGGITVIHSCAHGGKVSLTIIYQVAIKIDLMFYSFGSDCYLRIGTDQRVSGYIHFANRTAGFSNHIAYSEYTFCQREIAVDSQWCWVVEYGNIGIVVQIDDQVVVGELGEGETVHVHVFNRTTAGCNKSTGSKCRKYTG